MALVLSRRNEEGITLDLTNVDMSKLANKVIRIITKNCRDGKVQYVIDADRSIPVHRDEVQRRIEEELRHNPRGAA